MNYYEELGLAPGASADEVRQAYRTLARLLHPDSQPDGHLRSAAERQMKRLNEILATLCDPHKRREYDDALRLPVSNRVAGPRCARERGGFLPHGTAMVILPQKQPAWRQAAVRYWYYILIGALWLATAVAWWAVPRAETAVINAPSAPVDTQHASNAATAERRQSSRRAQRAARSAVVRTPKAPGDPAVPEHVSENLPLPEANGTSVKEQPSGADSGMCATCEGAATEIRRSQTPAGFGGSWLYAPQAGVPAVPGRYRALYIECLLKEEAGEVVGTYRAKYKVPDQAISPEVTFQIRGAAPAGNSGRLVWTAGDGARGTLELTLRSPDMMGVVWWTTTAGRRPSLSSGEGVLIRQAAP